MNICKKGCFRYPSVHHTANELKFYDYQVIRKILPACFWMGRQTDVFAEMGVSAR